MNNQQGGGPQQHPKEVFCGNLSFFCQESDLFQLFQDYARVRSVRVIRNQERTKSLMFGFVRFETTAEAEEMARVFNGQMFLGRRIKVTHPGVEDVPHPDMLVGDGEGPPVHLSFACSPDNPVRPTELLLRKTMVLFGPVNDVTVREFMFNDTTQRCEGYGFVSFFTKQTSFELASITNEIVVEGISIRPSLSYRATGGNPMVSMNNGFQMTAPVMGGNSGGGGGRGGNHNMNRGGGGGGGNMSFNHGMNGFTPNGGGGGGGGNYNNRFNPMNNNNNNNMSGTSPPMAFGSALNGRGGGNNNHFNNGGNNNNGNFGGGMNFNNRNNNNNNNFGGSGNGGFHNGNNMGNMGGGMNYRNNNNNMGNSSFNSMNHNNNNNNNDFMMGNNSGNNSIDGFNSMSSLGDSLGMDMMMNTKSGNNNNSNNYNNLYMNMGGMNLNGIARSPSSDDEDDHNKNSSNMDSNNNSMAFGFAGNNNSNNNDLHLPLPPSGILGSSASSVTTASTNTTAFGVLPPGLSDSPTPRNTGGVGTGSNVVAGLDNTLFG